MSDIRKSRSRKVSLAEGQDPRERSSVGDSLTADMLGPGLELVNGKIQLKLSPESPYYTDEMGYFNLRAAKGLVVAPGSPMALQAVPADASVEVTPKGLRARPSASQVRNDSSVAGATVKEAMENAMVSTPPAVFTGLGGGNGVVHDTGGVPTGLFLRDDGTFAVAGGGGSGSAGVATVDFGAFPGASDASVAVTGQAGILAGSVVMACILGVATADHSADEHWVESIQVVAGNIVPGTGFTIYARNTAQAQETPLGWLSSGQNRAGKAGRGTRLVGQFSVAWRWS